MPSCAYTAKCQLTYQRSHCSCVRDTDPQNMSRATADKRATPLINPLPRLLCPVLVSLIFSFLAVYADDQCATTDWIPVHKQDVPPVIRLVNSGGLISRSHKMLTFGEAT